jgi:hypothetical protein
MKFTLRTALAAVLVLAGAAGWVAAQAGDDDLKVVQKATGTRPASSRVERIPPVGGSEPSGSRVTAQATPAPAPPRSQASDRPAPAPRPRGVAPQWFKVRIVERGHKNARVTVNLPLNLVRALGDDWPVHAHCRECRNLKLSEILETLTTGQDIVDIESEDATVRVWLE